MIDSCPEGATELRVLQDGLVVAGSTSEKEASLYGAYQERGMGAHDWAVRTILNDGWKVK